MDSRTNLEIANLTSKIARDAQRDSSSMITIAAVTMVFLPGTFISAVFSMAFFNAGTDENGKATLEVSPLVWYFPAVTIPLTILVLLVWEFWRRRRQDKILPAGKKLRGNEATPGTLQVDVIINHLPTFNSPGTIICRNLAPGVCCRRRWISYNNGATSYQQGLVASLEFRNLLVGDIAAVWRRGDPVTQPRNGNDCSTRIISTGHGPGDYTYAPPAFVSEPGGGSYISVGQMKLPPGAGTASALLIQGIFGLVWGGGQWFGSAAAANKYGSEGPESKVKRGIMSADSRGTVFAQPPMRWVDPDVINVNGTEYLKSSDGVLVYRDVDGNTLNTTTMEPPGG
ncbi:MAG: hypothetical protein Q9169_006241 [Polycauliona sp. 2 TL-2023]